MLRHARCKLYNQYDHASLCPFDRFSEYYKSKHVSSPAFLIAVQYSLMGISGHASGSAVIGTTIATTVLACIAVALRLYTRLILVRKPGIDDVCITVALVRSNVALECMDYDG